MSFIVPQGRLSVREAEDVLETGYNRRRSLAVLTNVKNKNVKQKRNKRIAIYKIKTWTQNLIAQLNLIYK